MAKVLNYVNIFNNTLTFTINYSLIIAARSPSGAHSYLRVYQIKLRKPLVNHH